MLSATLLLLQASQLPQVDQPKRLRTILPNGAVILVEPRPRDKSITLQIVASARGSEETAATNGRRHLLEHLIAQGPKRDVDRMLESQGAFLRAQTFRDVMSFEVTLPPGKLDLGIKALQQVLQIPAVTPEQIATEVTIIKQELALTADANKLADAAWTTAYGESGLSALGDPEAMAKQTPDTLKALFRQHFAADNLVIAVSGPVNLDTATAAVSVLASGRVHAADRAKPRGEGKPGSASADATGDARGAPVGPYSARATMATLAAALAVASEVRDSFLIYTPSPGNGMIIAGQLTAPRAFGERVDGLKPQEVDEMFERGKMAAKNWVERQMQGGVNLRGFLLSFDANARPEQMLEAIAKVTLPEFRAGVDSFKTGKAIVVVGSR